MPRTETPDHLTPAVLLRREGGIVDAIEDTNGNVANGKPASPLAPFAEGEAEKAPGSGRDAKGRFLKGVWKGGPGNPHARRVAQLRREFLAAMTPKKMRKLAHSLYEFAVGGDLESLKLLLAYVVGPPQKEVDPDRLDLDEWRLLLSSPSESEVWHAREQIDTTLALAVARGASLVPLLALLSSSRLSGQATAPRVRAALEEAGFSWLVQELDALQRRIAENESCQGHEEEGDFPEMARRAHAKKKLLDDG
jgi:hypothetical protein